MTVYARPASDVDVTGWTDQSGGTTNLFSKLDETSHSESDYVKRDLPGDPPAVPPQRVVVVLMDDMRFDDVYAVLQGSHLGSRAGERCLEQTLTRIRDNALVFPYARVDYAFCGPARASVLTGLFRQNHGIDNDVASYYENCRRGFRDTRIWTGGTQVNGPWELDLAKQYGLADTPVDASTVPIVGFNGNYRRTDSLGRTTSADDLQAFTGSLPNWLAQAGIKCGFIGKYQNDYGGMWNAPFNVPGPLTNLFVPPGWQFWVGAVGDDTDYNQRAASQQDHYHVRTCEYSGTNPGDGNGKTGVEYSYDYDYAISSITWSSGEAIVTVSSAIEGNGITFAVGDEVAIEGVTGVTTYNGPARVVTAVDSTTQFRFAISGPLSAGTTTNAVAYPRPLFSEQVFGQKALAFLAETDDTTPFYLHLCPRIPHADVAGNTVEEERRYRGVWGDAVNHLDFGYWDGVAGDISPAVTPGSVTTARQRTWMRRQEMIASFDDWFGVFLDELDARHTANPDAGWDDTTIIFLSDNGFQNGDHEDTEGTDVWSAVGAKGWDWEASVRVPLFIRSADARFSPGTNNMPVTVADIPLTVMDIFSSTFPSLAEHHAHSNRDGRSLLRLLTGTDVSQDRALIHVGKYVTENWCPAIVDQDLMKLVRSQVSPSTRKLFDLTESDWETVDRSATYPDVVTELASRLTALQAGRWNPTTRVNTCRTA